MELKITIVAATKKESQNIASSLKRLTKDLQGIEMHPVDKKANQDSFGPLVLIHEKLPGLAGYLKLLNREKRIVILLTKDSIRVPSAWSAGTVDDLLTLPMRKLEVMSKLLWFEQIYLLQELGRLNQSFSKTLQLLDEDLKLAQRIHRACWPIRLPDVPGFKIRSRYLAGLRPGGDFFDLLPFSKKGDFCIALSTSSSYGLAGAVLSILMQIMIKLSLDRIGQKESLARFARQVQEELSVILKEKDHLSLFLGVVNRSEMKLRLLSLGSVSCFIADSGKEFKPVPVSGPALQKATTEESHKKVESYSEVQIPISTGTRLVLVSFGVQEALGGPALLQAFLNKNRHLDVSDLLNELTYQIQSKIDRELEMPASDCTALVVDVESLVLALG